MPDSEPIEDSDKILNGDVTKEVVVAGKGSERPVGIVEVAGPL